MLVATPVIPLLKLQYFQADIDRVLYDCDALCVRQVKIRGQISPKGQGNLIHNFSKSKDDAMDKGGPWGM